MIKNKTAQKEIFFKTETPIPNSESCKQEKKKVIKYRFYHFLESFLADKNICIPPPFLIAMNTHIIHKNK